MRADGLATLTASEIAVLRNGLRLMALRALGDVDSAEDAVQETLVRALDAVTPEIAADPARLGAFAGGIARHVISDMRRRASRSVALSETSYPLAADDVLEFVIRGEEHHLVNLQISRLSPADQTVLRASFFEGLSPLEIAERINESPEVVRKRKSRALARLRAAFEASGHVEQVQASIG